MNAQVQVEMLYDRLLVRCVGENNRTKSGLFIPDMALSNTPYVRAEVVEVGHGRIAQSGDVIPLRVKVGDVVIFFRTGQNGDQLIYPAEDGTDLLIIREAHVAMILRDLPTVSPLVNQDGKDIILQ